MGFDSDIGMIGVSNFEGLRLHDEGVAKGKHQFQLTIYTPGQCLITVLYRLMDRLPCVFPKSRLPPSESTALFGDYNEGIH